MYFSSRCNKVTRSWEGIEPRQPKGHCLPRDTMWKNYITGGVDGVRWGAAAAWGLVGYWSVGGEQLYCVFFVCIYIYTYV